MSAYAHPVTAEPLDATALRTALAGRVAGLDVVQTCGSTNADLLAAARAGAPDRTVLVAERQERGRGRLDRSWVSPPGAGLTFSVLLRPVGVAAARVGWLPLLAGLAVHRAVREVSDVPVALKWPNDVLLGPGQAKGAGILAEADPGAPGGVAVVLGIGLNVRTPLEDLPEGGTSLLAEGADLDRAGVLVAVLNRLIGDEAAWREAGGDPDATGLRAGYTEACATLGRSVRVVLPGAADLVGTAVELDSDGRLVLVDDDRRRHSVAAGDVVHLRPLAP
jgi:BirA family biotin operon repressor/biotin-[acetyl-CoA-carboxylase] ligase